MSVFITLTGCWLAVFYSSIEVGVLSWRIFFKKFKLTNEKHFHFLNIVNFFIHLRKSNNFLTIVNFYKSTLIQQFFGELREICVEPVLIKLVMEELIQFNYSKEHIDLIWNGLMQSDDFKWWLSNVSNVHT